MSFRLKLAVQKTGRLSEQSLKLLRDAGLLFDLSANILRSSVENFPLDILFLRDDDIAAYVKDAVVDIGIVGANVVREQNIEVKWLENLGFGRCRLSLAVPKASSIKRSEELNGLKIATSYPSLLSAFLKERRIQAEIHTLSGAVEIAPSLGLAQAVCDLVSSGSTLLSNGLRELEPIFRSEAILIANESKDQLPETQRLLKRLRSVLRARRTKYILLNAPNECVSRICEILPGLKSPSIVPLSEPGWCSMHSVVEEDEFWESIEKLEQAGAQGILVLNIEKVIL